MRGSGHRGVHHLADVLELIDRQHSLNQRLDIARRQHHHRLIAELLLQLLVGQRPMDVAERLLDELRQPPAVRELDLDVRLILGDRRIAHGGRRFTHTLDHRIVHRLVGVLAQPPLPRTSPTAAP